MRVKHLGLKDAELNVGGKAVRSDQDGIFDVSDEVGAVLLGMRGYFRPRETREVRNAERAYKKSEAVYLTAKADFDDKKERLLDAQHQADAGGGTEFREGDLEHDYSEDPDPAPTPPAEPPKHARQPSKPAAKPVVPEETEASDELEEDLEEKSAQPSIGELLQKHRGVEPSMRWPLDDLIMYAQAKGVAAETGWTKAQVLGELENLEAD